MLHDKLACVKAANNLYEQKVKIQNKNNKKVSGNKIYL